MELKASRKQRERAQLEGKDGGLGSSPEASEQQQQNRNRRRTINAGSRVRARERTGGASGGLGPKPGHLTGKKAGRRAGWPGPARGWGRSHFPQNTILNSLSIERNTIPPKFLVFFFFFFLIYFWLCWVFVSARGLSLVAASGGHSSSRCAGLSLSRPLPLRSTGSRRAGSAVVAHGPSCSAVRGILPDQGSNPCPPYWQADSQPPRHQGRPLGIFKTSKRQNFCSRDLSECHKQTIHLWKINP